MEGWRNGGMEGWMDGSSPNREMGTHPMRVEMGAWRSEDIMAPMQVRAAADFKGKVWIKTKRGAHASKHQIRVKLESWESNKWSRGLNVWQVWFCVCRGAPMLRLGRKREEGFVKRGAPALQPCKYTCQHAQPLHQPDQVVPSSNCEPRSPAATTWNTGQAPNVGSV